MLRALVASIALLAAACGRRSLPRTEPVAASASAPSVVASVAAVAAVVSSSPLVAVAPTASGASAASAVARTPGSLAEPASVERLAVPGDREASLVASGTEAGPLTVFVPGVCSNAFAYLLAFPEAARKHGGIVAIDGDLPCGPERSGFRSFSGDPEKQHRRITAALAAAGTTAIPREGITLVGYSLGATIAERLVQRYPDRYARLVVIGAPHPPAAASYREARAVVTMSCSLDVTARMRQGAVSIGKVGVPAMYVEMPGCTHGNIAQGERIFDETFTWLDAHALPPREGALAGALPGENPAR